MSLTATAERPTISPSLTQADGQTRELSPLLRPTSACVIGASPNRSKLANKILRNVLRAKGLDGIFPVNPGYKFVEGLQCFSSVLDIGRSVDMAIICLPAAKVLDALNDCIAGHVRAAVIISSGFAEMQTPEGRSLQEDLRQAAQGNIRILGPNTMGFYIPETGLDALFLDRETFVRPGRGGIALVTQSGSLGVYFMEELSTLDCGLSMFIGLGNELDVDECDVLEYLAHDPNTRAIGMYLESISDGERFFRVANDLARKKPMILLKGGRTSSGTKATGLHTGRLSGSYGAIKGIMEQTGIIEARDEVEILDLVRAFSTSVPVRGDRAMIVTNGGGNGIVCADILEEDRKGVLRLVDLAPDTKQALGRYLPPYISVSNPLDITAQASDNEYVKVLGHLCENRLCDVIILGLTTSGSISGALPERLSEVAGRYNMPLFVYLKGDAISASFQRKFERAGIPAYGSVRQAVRAANAVARWYKERDDIDTR